VATKDPKRSKVLENKDRKRGIEIEMEKINTKKQQQNFTISYQMQ
jgi:hypothetical protein